MDVAAIDRQVKAEADERRKKRQARERASAKKKAKAQAKAAKPPKDNGKAALAKVVQAHQTARKAKAAATPEKPMPPKLHGAYPEPTCVECGCTESTACQTVAGPCAWTQLNKTNAGLCTACAHP